jgi:hypothetical protein
MGKQLRESPPSPRSKAPGLPFEVEQVIVKALEKSKKDRFATAREMREAMEEALVAPDRRKSRSKRIAAAAIASVMLLGGLAVATTRTKTEVAALSRGGPDENAAPSRGAVAPTPTLRAAEITIPEVAIAADPPQAPVEALPPAAPATEPKPAPKETRRAEREPEPEPIAPKESDHGGLLQRASARHGSDAKARLSDARTHAKEHASDTQALRAWATAALQAGENREARRAAEAWASHDATAEPRLFLAAALEAMGRKREARAVLDEWLSNHPDHPEARRMRDHLGSTPSPAIKSHGRTRAPRPDTDSE